MPRVVCVCLVGVLGVVDDVTALCWTRWFVMLMGVGAAVVICYTNCGPMMGSLVVCVCVYLMGPSLQGMKTPRSERVNAQNTTQRARGLVQRCCAE